MRVLDCGRKGTFHTVAFDSTGQFLAAGGELPRTYLWDVATGTNTFQFPPPFWESRLSFQPVRNQLLIPTKDGLRAFDPTTGRPDERFAGGLDLVEALAFAPTPDWAICSDCCPDRSADRFGSLLAV